MGFCNTEASVVFWRLWCSGVCTVWDLHFLGSAVLGVCVARGSVFLGAPRCSRLWILSFPRIHLCHSRSLLPAAVPVPFPAGASSSPFPPPDTPDHPSDVTSRRDPPRHCSWTPPLPAPPGLAAPSPPCPGSRRGLQHRRLSRPSCRSLESAPRVPTEGTGFLRGDAATDGTAPAKGDKDTNPRAGRSPARASRWNEGGNRDRTRGLVAPAWFVVTVL